MAVRLRHVILDFSHLPLCMLGTSNQPAEYDIGAVVKGAHIIAQYDPWCPVAQAKCGVRSAGDQSGGRITIAVRFWPIQVFDQARLRVAWSMIR